MLLLGGGRGMRLRPVVADRPKLLAEVGGRPFVAYLLDRLHAAGIRRVVLCTGFGADAMQRALGTACAGVALVHSAEPSPCGTAGALRWALPHVTSQTVLVLNGDSICDVDLAAAWAFHHDVGARATLVLAAVEDAARYGRVELEADGRVRHFAEKDGAAGPALVNAGVYLLDAGLLAAIPPERAVSLERDLLPTLVGRGLYGYRGVRRFLDIGTPEDYARAARFLAAGAA